MRGTRVKELRKKTYEILKKYPKKMQHFGFYFRHAKKAYLRGEV